MTLNTSRRPKEEKSGVVVVSGCANVPKRASQTELVQQLRRSPADSFEAVHFAPACNMCCALCCESTSAGAVFICVVRTSCPSVCTQEHGRGETARDGEMLCPDRRKRLSAVPLTAD